MTPPTSPDFAPTEEGHPELRPATQTKKPRCAGGLRNAAHYEVSHPDTGADQARAIQSSKLPTPAPTYSPGRTV